MKLIELVIPKAPNAKPSKEEVIKGSTIKTFDEPNANLPPGHRDKTISEIRKHLDTHCAKAVKSYQTNQTFIYRGIPTDEISFVVDTDLVYRRSAYSDNIYTKLIDISPAWKHHAYRSRSISCSTDFNKVLGYGESKHGQTYIIFPYDDAKISYGMNSDFWYDFEGLGISNLSEFNNLIESSAAFFKFSDKTLLAAAALEDNQPFIAAIKKIEKLVIGSSVNLEVFIHHLNKYVTSHSEEFGTGFYEAAINKNLLDWLMSYLDPTKNEIKTIDASKIHIIRGRVEIWVQGKVLLFSATDNDKVTELLDL